MLPHIISGLLSFFDGMATGATIIAGLFIAIYVPRIAHRINKMHYRLIKLENIAEEIEEHTNAIEPMYNTLHKMAREVSTIDKNVRTIGGKAITDREAKERKQGTEAIRAFFTGLVNILKKR